MLTDVYLGDVKSLTFHVGFEPMPIRQLLRQFFLEPTLKLKFFLKKSSAPLGDPFQCDLGFAISIPPYESESR